MKLPPERTVVRRKACLNPATNSHCGLKLRLKARHQIIGKQLTTMFRIILLGTSGTAVLALLAFWTISGRALDIIFFAALTFLVANIVYIFISRPTLKTSDVLTRVSGSLAVASMELQYQAEEAQMREAEAERLRVAEDEHNRQKLLVAKEMLQNLRLKRLQNSKEHGDLPRITHQPQLKSTTLPSSKSVSATADVARFSNNRDAAGKATPPASQVASPAEASALAS